MLDFGARREESRRSSVGDGLTEEGCDVDDSCRVKGQPITRLPSLQMC